MIKRIAIPALLCVALLAFIGAGKPRSYGGSGYGAKSGATYAAGGAETGYDTRTIIFTTQDVLTTDSNHASIDTSLVWGRTPNTFTSPATRDFARRVTFTQRLARADSVYRLGTGYDVPNFCWGAISSRDTSGVSNGVDPKFYPAVREAFYPDGVLAYMLSVKFPSTTALANDNGEPARACPMVYLPLRNRIPAGATIVSATMSVSNNANTQFAYIDSIFAVLMTNANDSQWYTTKDAVDAPNYPNFAHVSWMRQETTNGGGWWNGTNRWVWNPTLDNRPYYWSWGNVCDWTGSRYQSETAGEYSTNYIPTKTGFDIDITNCVQAAVNGTTNNGIIFMAADGNGTTNDWGFYGFDNYGAAIGRTPYITIKYITKKYTKPFGTGDWAFLASTDDGKYLANRAYADTFKAHGMKYTIFQAQSQINTAGGATYRQLVNFHTQDGMEVGSHSREHRSAGLAHWPQQAMPDTVNLNTDPDGAGPKTAAADTMWQALLRDAQPRWMYTVADTIYGDLRGDPYYGKSLGLPQSTTSPEVQLALEKLGYTAVRYKALDSVQDSCQFYYVRSTMRPAKTDSFQIGGVGAEARKARNAIVVPTTLVAQAVFARKGNLSSTVAETDSLRQNLRRLVYQIRGQKRNVISMFWHDTKTAPQAVYSEGVDGYELGPILSEVTALGGRAMTISEYVRWVQGGSKAIAYPWSTAKPDTFREAAETGVWIKPNGIDSKPIMGIKQ